MRWCSELRKLRRRRCYCQHPLNDTPHHRFLQILRIPSAVVCTLCQTNLELERAPFQEDCNPYGLLYMDPCFQHAPKAPMKISRTSAFLNTEGAPCRRAFPERYLALLVTLAVEVPVALIITGGSKAGDRIHSVRLHLPKFSTSTRQRMQALTRQHVQARPCKHTDAPTQQPAHRQTHPATHARTHSPAHKLTHALMLSRNPHPYNPAPTSSPHPPTHPPIDPHPTHRCYACMYASAYTYLHGDVSLSEYLLRVSANEYAVLASKYMWNRVNLCVHEPRHMRHNLCLCVHMSRRGTFLHALGIQC